MYESIKYWEGAVPRRYTVGEEDVTSICSYGRARYRVEFRNGCGKWIPQRLVLKATPQQESEEPE